MLVWVNACTNEVQNCRQIASIRTVILKGIPDSDSSASSGQHVAGNVTVKAKGDLAQELQPLKIRIWSVIPCNEKFYMILTHRYSGKLDDDGSSSWKEYMECINIGPNFLKGLTPYQTPGELTSQTKKERYEVCWQEGSEMPSQE